MAKLPRRRKAPKGDRYRLAGSPLERDGFARVTFCDIGLKESYQGRIGAGGRGCGWRYRRQEVLFSRRESGTLGYTHDCGRR